MDSRVAGESRFLPFDFAQGRNDKSSYPARLKYWTAFSCFFAATLVWKVPRLRRFPVFGFFLREYNRYLPDFSFLIIRSTSYHFGRLVNAALSSGHPLTTIDTSHRQEHRPSLDVETRRGAYRQF